MKTNLFKFKKEIMVITFVCFHIFAIAQNDIKKERLTVLEIDSKGITLTPEQLGNLVRIEIGKTNLYEVMDQYDIMYAVDKNQLQIKGCYGKLCLVELGKQLNVDKILTGSVELYGETLIVTLRLIDINNNTIEKTQIDEFLNLQNDIQSMITVSISKMFNLPVNTLLEARLTNKYNYDNLVNNPDDNTLKLSGPRMGFTLATGRDAEIWQAPKAEGGFDAYPAMFQFGYQFEKQYLNEGNFQALFEFIPMITGIDQGYILPSLTVMNGLRNNINGWEFAFGPTFYTTREANGYVVDDKWYYESDMTDELYSKKYSREYRFDSRGDIRLRSGFIVAFGKTFISGKLNIPVNIYVAPNRDGFRFGMSFGYNAKK